MPPRPAARHCLLSLQANLFLNATEEKDGLKFAKRTTKCYWPCSVFIAPYALTATCFLKPALSSASHQTQELRAAFTLAVVMN